ncbi:acetyl-CoA synthetase [Nowakowskiella sp. JEL0078]|nr:acetyl-CoA synthetase [Nowakowskiella sp. JEL0078]
MRQPLAKFLFPGVLIQSKSVQTPFLSQYRCFSSQSKQDEKDIKEFDSAKLHPVPRRLLENGPKPHVFSLDQYKAMYKKSISAPEPFFGELAVELLDWYTPFSKVKYGDFERGDIAWFLGGQLNASYNCIDRHAFKNPDKVAIIWEADEPGLHKSITYGELLQDVSRFANVLKSLGVKKGDTVAVYMPMVPEAAIAMLACTRIGAIHSVIFAGFSSDSLRDRIQDANCKVLITADQGKRGGKTVHLKQIADEAVSQCPCIKKVVVFQRTGDPSVQMIPDRDVWWHDEILKQRTYCPPERMESEDPIFMLYTSGSTGKPKGVVHTTGGYLLGAASTIKYIFDIHPGDIFGCMSDVGWVNGHTYTLYGPLLSGITTVLFESIPTYPDASRYWQVVDKHKITQFYTAPTAIRALRRLGDEFIEPYSLSTLRVIGSVGEPINPEAWLWYEQKVGRGQCAVVDTYWQTETGSIIVTAIPGATATKPGSATLPFFGVDLAVLDPSSGEELLGNDVTGVLAVKQPIPSISRSVHKNHKRYLDTYMKPYPGYYFTGDGVTRDKDGYYWIRGRVDDVINVAGHRMSTAEIESALILHPQCAEAAAVGINDEITGQAVICFVTLKTECENESETIKSLIGQVRTHIGPFATPKRVILVHDLPKTRSGKIMRRVLRKIAGGEVNSEDLKSSDGESSDEKLKEKLGDLSTIDDPSIIATLIRKFSH